MVFLGMLAFLQITMFPGAIILKVFNFRGTFFQRLIYIFALSLIVSYILVIFLTLIHLYNQVSILVVLIGEMIGLAWLYNEEMQKSIFQRLQGLIERTRRGIDSFIELNTEHKPSDSLNIILTVILAAMAFAGVMWAARIFINNFGSAFDAWDSVVSWNRWALGWAAGQIPLDSGFYPQLIPANWSLTYVLTGSTVIQTFAKGIMPLFAVFILLMLFDLGLETKSFGFFIGGIFAQLLLKKFLTAEIANGYVDVAVAFFGLLSIHALIKAGMQGDSSLSDQYLLWGAIFAGGAAVTKQPGVYIFALYPILAYIHVIRHFHPELQNALKKYLLSFLLVSLIPLSWYLFKETLFLLQVDTSDIQTYFEITAQAYEQSSLPTQIAAALSHFEIYLLLFVFIIASLRLLDPLMRTLTLLIVLPYPFLWAWMAGYDSRNLAIFIPIFAMVGGISLQKIYSYIISQLEQTPFFRSKTYSAMSLFLVVMAVILFIFPSSTLIEQQIQMRRQIFSPSKNEQIYAIVEQEGPDTKILTNYPVQFLPGLENNQVAFGFKSLDSFLIRIENPEIQYILFSNKASDKIKQYIDERVSSGDYELIFNDKEWIPYKMVHIINRR